MSRKVGFYAGKFLPIHRGHVYAMLHAYSIVDELHILVSYDEEYEKDVLFKDAKLPYVDYEQRVRWWQKITRDLENVYIHAYYEKNDNIFSSWEAGSKKIKELVGKEITHVFSSESS